MTEAIAADCAAERRDRFMREPGRLPTDAVVWVNHPEMMFETLGGMSILERQLFSLAQVGVKRVWIAARKTRETARMRTPPGLEISWVQPESDGPVEARHPYLGVSGDHLVRRGVLEDILSRPHTRPVSYQDELRLGVLQILPFRGERVIEYAKEPLPRGAAIRLRTPADKGPALPWLLEGARKNHDGFMARHFDRRISLTITRVLLNTPVKPNHMTVLSSLLGLSGALQFAKGGHSAAVAGAALLWLHTVLDGCDGELARLKFQESRLGRMLDFWGDNLVHLLLFACLGVGLYRPGAPPLPLQLSLLACCGVLGSAFLSFSQSILRSRQETAGACAPLGLPPTQTGPARTLQSIEIFLAQRDFIYLLVLAALLEKQASFLWAGAIGAPVFFVILFYLVRQGLRAAPCSPEVTRHE